VDTKHPVDVTIANEGLVIFNTPNVFPEYFFISVPMFDDVINSEIDEWLYVMKHSEIRQGFKSPYMTKVAERLSVIKMSSEERNEYIYYQKQSVHSQDILSAAEAKGEAKGKAEGASNKAIEIAKAMLLEGDSNEKIAKITGLSIEDIEKLKILL
jgi:predicted transposase/invertase (TIGR01784 family)